MAEVNVLEEKLAEVLGLAQAAQATATKIEGLVEDDAMAKRLQHMRQETEETERRCTDLADQRDGKKTAILDKARETKSEAEEMMGTYLGDDADGLDGFEFMTMAEAGEVGHWAVLGKLKRAGWRRRDRRACRVGAPDSGTPPRDRQAVLTRARCQGGPLRGVGLAGYDDELRPPLR